MCPGPCLFEAAIALAGLMPGATVCRFIVSDTCHSPIRAAIVMLVAVPRAGWAEALKQFGIPKGHTGPAEEMFEAVNAGWMDLGVEGTEHVAGTTSARDVFEAAQDAANS